MGGGFSFLSSFSAPKMVLGEMSLVRSSESPAGKQLLVEPREFQTWDIPLAFLLLVLAPKTRVTSANAPTTQSQEVSSVRRSSRTG